MVVEILPNLKSPPPFISSAPFPQPVMIQSKHTYVHMHINVCILCIHFDVAAFILEAPAAALMLLLTFILSINLSIYLSLTHVTQYNFNILGTLWLNHTPAKLCPYWIFRHEN